MRQKRPSLELVKHLEDVWYSKLKKTGFRDIEDTSRSNRPLKTWHTYRFKTAETSQRLATEAYYDEAKDLLLTYSFKNETHKVIWELHCEGYSKRKIEKIIRSLPKVYKREMIGIIINTIAKEIKK